jgi:hypothetical protein
MGFVPPSQSSPRSGSMSDNNSHGTPAISPGSWNVPTPESRISGPYDSPLSAQSRSSSSAPPHTPSSVSSASTGDYPALPSELGKVEEMKSFLDMERERLAESKALKLMSQTVGVTPQFRSGAGALTARQAAARRGEMQNDIAIESKNRYKEEKEKMKPIPILATPRQKERLATSTRKVKQSPESEAEFGETVDDMKCELDREREQFAERKALRLLRLTDRLA